MSDTRSALRQQLLSARQTWSATPAAAQAQADLHAQVLRVLTELEPQCLGLYWPIRGEFNPRDVALTFQASLGGPSALSLALPWATKARDGQAASMGYRVWDGSEPTTRDECGIPCPEGPPADPDVVLVPCVGFTPEGYRLGYGAGYFDRYMAAHPHTTAVGLAWAEAQLPPGSFSPAPHDQALMLIVTPAGVMG